MHAQLHKECDREENSAVLTDQIKKNNILIWNLFWISGRKNVQTLSKEFLLLDQSWTVIVFIVAHSFEMWNINVSQEILYIFVQFKLVCDYWCCTLDMHINGPGNWCAINFSLLHYGPKG